MDKDRIIRYLEARIMQLQLECHDLSGIELKVKAARHSEVMELYELITGKEVWIDSQIGPDHPLSKGQ